MLFTGKGDGGTTKAFDTPSGQRISKASELPEALGTLDELNAFIGFTRAQAGADPHIAPILREVQENLFIVQAQTAGADKVLPENAVTQTEDIVNAIEKEIAPLKGFSIAGGTELSAMLDVARTMSRRTERRIVGIKEQRIRDLPPLTMTYLNRLSSLLFALARLANHRAGVAEENPHY